MTPQERRDAIDLLTARERERFATALTKETRDAALDRLSTNRVFFEGLDDAGLAMRVAALRTPGSNVRCSCDETVCSCEPLARRDAANTDPVEAARLRRDMERRGGERRQDEGDPVEAARLRRDMERRGGERRHDAGNDPVEVARLRRDAARGHSPHFADTATRGDARHERRLVMAASTQPMHGMALRFDGSRIAKARKTSQGFCAGGRAADAGGRA